MTINNESDVQGEYQFIGYNAYGALISNDRWFNTADNIGKIFDKEYSGVEWHALSEFLGGIPPDTTLWASLSQFDYSLYNYIINAPFFDSDHVTRGEVPTGETLATLLPDGQWMTKSYLVTTPTQFEDGVVYLEYTKNGRRDYNTIQIPALPRVDCHMTATSDVTAIEAGSTRDVVVTIDTSGSYALLFHEKHPKTFPGGSIGRKAVRFKAAAPV
jgi:hypothetical protein